MAARRFLSTQSAVRASPISSEALGRIGALIGALYSIDKGIRGTPPQERRRVRQEKAAPPLDDMKRRFETSVLTLREIGHTKAIDYSLNRRPALVYYCSDGQAGTDNMIAERALRGVAFRRLNFYLLAPTQAENVQPLMQPDRICLHERH
ncbi:IS66 family transposase [Paraburkholderia sp. RL17-373-BIF-A]|uniref:IS66 family transposase n=1 Tax=Paraburkholderia sp. RL17-373-BIF-A TaxID=3031629 RepID=UPI0038BDFC5C